MSWLHQMGSSKFARNLPIHLLLKSLSICGLNVEYFIHAIVTLFAFLVSAIDF